MKKIFAILTIAVVLTACNNRGEEKKVVVDSAAMEESPLMDAMITADSAGKIIHDSTHLKPDTLNKK